LRQVSSGDKKTVAQRRQYCSTALSDRSASITSLAHASDVIDHDVTAIESAAATATHLDRSDPNWPFSAVGSRN